jgi:hypothetical protein
VLSLNLDWDTDCPDWGYLWYSPIPPGKCQKNISIRPWPLPPNPFQFIHHSMTWCYTVLILKVLLNNPPPPSRLTTICAILLPLNTNKVPWPTLVQNIVTFSIILSFKQTTLMQWLCQQHTVADCHDSHKGHLVHLAANNTDSNNDKSSRTLLNLICNKTTLPSNCTRTFLILSIKLEYVCINLFFHIFCIVLLKK